MRRPASQQVGYSNTTRINALQLCAEVLIGRLSKSPRNFVEATIKIIFMHTYLKIMKVDRAAIHISFITEYIQYFGEYGL